ncbi:MAG: DUF4959 domain-containing protein [Prevotella sp.]|nr:DUF4959 domain-containing protein [Prevotella sp.]
MKYNYISLITAASTGKYCLLDKTKSGLKILCLIALVCTLPLLTGCSEEKNESLESGGDAPGKVLNVQATSLPGGAEITYELPDDGNLSYVEAIVELPGTTMNYKASSYNNKLTVQGLSSTADQLVQLYSVSRSGVKSDPVDVTIKPLEPPYLSVFKTLGAKETFGGVYIEFDNPTTSELAFYLGYYDEDGTYEDWDSYYSELEDGRHSYRGLESIEREFGICVQDRWNNRSDTLFVTLTPLYEEMLDKSLFRDLTLPGDVATYESTGGEWNINKVNIWDGKWSQNFDDPYTGNGTNYLNFTTRGENNFEPTHFTIDMGQKAQLSRCRVNHYSRYLDRALKRYEIWGCTNEPPADGSWDGWYKLGEYEQIKPSGLPGNTEQYGSGDAEAWEKGDEINFEPDAPVTRYIRVKTLENWAGFTNASLAEITFYGSPVN